MNEKRIQVAVIASVALIVVLTAAHAFATWRDCQHARCPEGTSARVVRGLMGLECVCVVERADGP